MTVQGPTMAPVSLAFRLNDAVNRLSFQNANLQEQLASGVLSDSYAGSADRRYQALDLQPQITQIGGWQTNITAAQNVLSVTQTVMSRVATIAINLQTSLTSLESDQSTTNVNAAATEARLDLTELASLLNTKSGSQYVFGGSVSNVPPIANPSAVTSSPFFRAITASVSSLSTTRASVVEAATITAAADNTSGNTVFSPALSVDGPSAAALTRSVTIGDEDHVMVGFVATEGGPTTPTSTGSSIRDLMRVLAVVGNLDQASTAGINFVTLVGDTATQTVSISSGLNLLIAGIGATQMRLNTQAMTLGTMSDVLTKQLGLTKDADAATLSTQMNATQNQLTASYTMIADMKGLSLATYI